MWLYYRVVAATTTGRFLVVPAFGKYNYRAVGEDTLDASIEHGDTEVYAVAIL